ncbi:MAG: AAA family ATPase, partial [Proteobacteria bacterium]|jgi:type II secretory pathway predicted ATPase ExeA|nr:AAA family ATPase [Pseudomonadota bacterium]
VSADHDGLTRRQKLRLRGHFGFTKAPFSKYMWATKMYDSSSQRDLLAGLQMWLELKGITLVTGPSGVGKSITLRRFVKELDEARYHVVAPTTLPSTPHGCLRSLSRELGLPMRQHTADLFDQVRGRLVELGKAEGPHPILVLDDAEGLRAPVMDVLRRLTASDLDEQDHFSMVLAGTDELLHTLQVTSLAPLRSRIGFTWQLRPYGLEDARQYVAYQLQRANVDAKVFSDHAVKRIFQASRGYPRSINQLALQALIQAAIAGIDTIDGDFMQRVCKSHPLYQGVQGAA